MAKIIKVSEQVYRALSDLKLKLNLRSYSQVIQFLLSHYDPDNMPLLQLLSQISKQLESMRSDIKYVLDSIGNNKYTETRQEYTNTSIQDKEEKYTEVSMETREEDEEGGLEHIFGGDGDRYVSQINTLMRWAKDYSDTSYFDYVQTNNYYLLIIPRDTECILVDEEGNKHSLMTLSTRTVFNKANRAFIVYKSKIVGMYLILKTDKGEEKYYIDYEGIAKV